MLASPISWHGWEWAAGPALAVAVAAAVAAFRRGATLTGVAITAAAGAVCLLFTLTIIAPNVQHMTQGGPVAFYRKWADQDVYVRSLPKSYADMFYGRMRLCDNPQSRDKRWLLSGDIDKPVYLVGREKDERRYAAYNLTVLRREAGFTYYLRMPTPVGSPPQTAAY
jgi:hypothetical protein